MLFQLILKTYSAPTPKNDRNFSLSNKALALSSLTNKETIIPTIKASGIEMIAGFLSGKIAVEKPNVSTQTVGLKIISVTALTAPVIMLATAPEVVNGFHIILIIYAGKLALAAIENAKPTINATFFPSKINPSNTDKTPAMMVAILAALISPFSSETPFLITFT
jgi:hypothetical protein